MKRFEPKVGERVTVCYDGKRSRGSRGVVLESKPKAIYVKFHQWAEAPDRHIGCCWFDRKSDYAFGGYLEIEDSLMKKAFGLPGDYYSVVAYKGEDK